jgi:hypothetical protein
VVSHLLFADDTLVFCNADVSQLEALRRVFTWFEVISGLKVNLQKSEMVPVGDVPNLEDLVAVLGCKSAALPMIYLGLPLGAKYNSKMIWNPIIEKMERKLGGWKRMYLSKGGKLILIKSTLSNLPTYFLSLFHLPADVAYRLEKIQRDFLWNGLGDQPKFHLLNWAKVCVPIEKGGLGVKNLRLFNQSLLGKWLWRYGKERDAFWRQVVEVKYGSLWGGWCSKHCRGAYGVGLWKGIRRGWDQFTHFISFSVGNGARVKFWSDVWVGDSTLKGAFPDLFSIAADKEAAVADYLRIQNDHIHWEVMFERNLQDWEIESLTSFLDRIYSASLNDSGIDQMCWQRDGQRGFTVKSYYSCLNASPPIQFPWKEIWKAKAPPRVAFFYWTAVWGKILSNDNLRKRRVVLVDWCCLCKKNGESSDHLFLHCCMAKQLWDCILNLFGLNWVMPRTVRELAGCWSGALGNHRLAGIWRMIPHCLTWCLWRERNLRTFEGMEMDFPELKLLFFRMLYDWIHVLGVFSFSSFQDFLDSCSSHSLLV